MLQAFLTWLNVVLPREEEGQGFVEYAFLIIFIALLVIVGLTLLAGGINSLFSNIGALLSGQAVT